MKIQYSNEICFEFKRQTATTAVRSLNRIYTITVIQSNENIHYRFELNTKLLKFNTNKNN